MSFNGHDETISLSTLLTIFEEELRKRGMPITEYDNMYCIMGSGKRLDRTDLGLSSYLVRDSKIWVNRARLDKPASALLSPSTGRVSFYEFSPHSVDVSNLYETCIFGNGTNLDDLE
jgi:hypothetical protein